MSDMKNIRRCKDSASWQVRINRNKRSNWQQFADADFGGPEESLEAAIAFRAEVIAVSKRHYAIEGAKKIEVEEPSEPYVLTEEPDMSWPKDFEQQFKEHNSKNE